MLISPALAWQASFKMTEQNLEDLSDIDMHLFAVSCNKGSAFMIRQRFAAANDKIIDNFDTSQAFHYNIFECK